MCDACDDNPMKWILVEGDSDIETGYRLDRLMVPMADLAADAPSIEGWTLLDVRWNVADMYNPPAKTFVYEQKTPTYFIVQYLVHEQYGGLEEGGWWYYSEEQQGDPVTIVKGERLHAEAICRSLNRLARKEQDGGRAPRYPRLNFTIDRWPGESDTADVRHHYC